MDLNKIYEGDCLDVLPTLTPGIIQTVITSPPYWGLRDYGNPKREWPAFYYLPMAGVPAVKVEAMVCAHGLEPDPVSYVGHEVLIFREVWKILRDDGTLWLNLGDSYLSNSSGGKRQSGMMNRARGQQDICQSNANGGPGLKSKDLCGMPWRVAMALQADGWYLRSDIIWSKPNPMPESVNDRPTKAHEYIFLMSKSKDYYYDNDAIREKFTQNEMANGFRGGAYCENATFDNTSGGKRKKGGNKKVPAGWDTAIGGNHGSFHKQGRKSISSAGYDQRKAEDWAATGGRPPMTMVDREYHPLGRNKRTVWSIATQPYKEAHFATFPEKLIEPCVLAGAPPRGVVLDIFDGSGTTNLVAARLNRYFVGIECNPAYIKLAHKRSKHEVEQEKFY